MRKLHVQLKHSTISQLRNYLKAGYLCDAQFLPIITTVVSSCRFQLAFTPVPHPVSSTHPPGEDIQCHVAVDVIALDGERYLHCIGRTTGWSEAGKLNRRDLSEQVRAFRHIQINLHGVPRTVLCDREYIKGLFWSTASIRTSR